MSRMGDVRSIDCRNRVYQIVTFGKEIDENRLYKLSTARFMEDVEKE